MKRSLPVLVILLLVTSSTLVFAQRSSRSELWHEVIRLRQQFQREKLEIIKARKRLAQLKKTLKTPSSDGPRP